MICFRENCSWEAFFLYHCVLGADDNEDDDNAHDDDDDDDNDDEDDDEDDDDNVSQIATVGKCIAAAVRGQPAPWPFLVCLLNIMMMIKIIS